MEAVSPTQALDAIGFGLFQWLLLLFTGMAWFADACEVMLLSFLSRSVSCEWGLSAGAESTLTSVVFAGMLLGVSFLGALADVVGRRRGFLTSAALLGIAGLASALAPSFGWLLAIRAVVGFALGGNPIAVTLFAEFLPSEQRGRWLFAMQSFWSLGTIFQALLAWVVLPTLGWRWLLVLSATPLLLLLAAYPLLPESPHWLCVQGRYNEAEAIVLRVATVNRYGRQLRVSFAPGGKEGALGAERSHAVDHSITAGFAEQEGKHWGGHGDGHGESLWEGHEEGNRGSVDSWVELPEGLEWDHRSGDWGGGATNGAAAAAAAAAGEAGGCGAGAALRQGVAGAGAGVEEWLEGKQGSEVEGLVRKARRRPPVGGGAAPGSTGGRSLQEDSSSSIDLGALKREGVLRQIWAHFRQVPPAAHVAFGQLFGPRLRTTTLLLYIIWFANAMLYYGLVLLTAALQTSGHSGQCIDGKANFTTTDFTRILVTGIAEAPGLLMAALLVDSIGRRWSIRGLLMGCASSLLLLGLSAGAQSWELTLLFIARGCIEGGYCALYIYTPEVYNTSVRSFGLSMCSAVSRIGGGLAPYATVYLISLQDSKASEVLLGTLCLAAVVAALFLPLETKGVDLHAHDHDHALPAEPSPAHAGEHPKARIMSPGTTHPLLHDQEPHAPLDIANEASHGHELGSSTEAGRAVEKSPLLNRHALPSS